MKRLTIIFIAIFFYTTAKADYDPLKLSELICIADYGAIGTIVKVDTNYFYLKVEEYILNKLSFDTLAIIKFEDWTCASRYDSYKEGQREAVFFRKSNYAIDNYELLGYGAGDEFELPIRYDSIEYYTGHTKLGKYLLSDFLLAIEDYDKLVGGNKGTSKIISDSVKTEFANKSNLHKLFIECKPYEEEKDFKISKTGILVNLENNYLYEDYENKIYITTANTDSIYLEADNTDIWKVKDYFIVKPKSGWTRRFINVYSINEKNKKHLLFNQLFDVIELPEPEIYFGSSIKDSIWCSYSNLIPRLGHYLDWLHKDENLDYIFLSYDYEIVSENQSDKFSIKSQYGTPELRKRLKKVKAGDKITISNILVLYPNNTVRQIKNKTIILYNKK